MNLNVSLVPIPSIANFAANHALALCFDGSHAIFVALRPSADFCQHICEKSRSPVSFMLRGAFCSSLLSLSSDPRLCPFPNRSFLRIQTVRPLELYRKKSLISFTFHLHLSFNYSVISFVYAWFRILLESAPKFPCEEIDANFLHRIPHKL